MLILGRRNRRFQEFSTDDQLFAAGTVFPVNVTLAVGF